MICKNIYILKIYSINYTLRWNTSIKKFPSDKKNVRKNTLFFLSQAPTNHSSTFNLRFLHELNHKARVSKTVWDFPFSIPFCFYLSLYFYSTKCMDSLTLKLHNSFQVIENPHSFEKFKIQWYLPDLELPKNWPGDEFFKLRKVKFWERQFFSIVTFK